MLRWIFYYVTCAGIAIVEALLRSQGLVHPFLEEFVLSWGCLGVFLVVIGFAYHVVLGGAKDSLLSREAGSFAVMMFFFGVVLYFTLFFDISALGGGAEPFGQRELPAGAVVAEVGIALLLLGGVATHAGYRGILEIRRRPSSNASGTTGPARVTTIGNMAHVIAVIAAAYAFVATALIVSAAVFLDGGASTVKQELSTIWVGVLASIATSVVVLAGTYLATFSDLANAVNEVFEEIKKGMVGVKRDLNDEGVRVKEVVSAAGQEVKSQLGDARTEVRKSTDALCEESHALSRQLITLTTAQRVNELPEKGRPSDAMNGAGCFHTAVLDASLNGLLAKNAVDFELVDPSDARTAISGMLGAYLLESAYDVVGGTIITNVDNYANVMVGAAAAIEKGISKGKRRRGRRNLPFFLINAVVSPAHSLNWPWYTELGKLPLRFAPDFLLRFITEVRRLSAERDRYIHGRIVTCKSASKDLQEKWEHLSFPSPPWVEEGGVKEFSADTRSEREIEGGAYPRIGILKMKSAVTGNAYLPVKEQENPAHILVPSAFEEVIRCIAEEYGTVGEGDDMGTMVAAWPIASEKGEEFVEACGTAECPFYEPLGQKIRPPKCALEILKMLGLLGNDVVNSFGGTRKGDPKDRVGDWRIGNPSVDWLWGSSRAKELTKFGELLEASNKKDLVTAASMVLDIITQIDRARWTFATDKVTRTSVRTAQRCLLVVANYLFHRAESGGEESQSVALNKWFSETLVSEPELGVVWDSKGAGDLAGKCISELGLDRDEKGWEKMSKVDVERRVEAFYKRHFALAGVIELKSDVSKAPEVASALKRYAKNIVNIGSESQRDSPSINDMLVIEATTGRPWRVSEISWKHGRGNGSIEDGDGHLQMGKDEAIAIWYYGQLLEESWGKEHSWVGLMGGMQ